MLEILRLRLEPARHGIVYVSSLFFPLDALLQIVFKHPLVVLSCPQYLNWFFLIVIELLFLLCTLKLHVRQVVQDEVHILNEFVKLAFIAL